MLSRMTSIALALSAAGFAMMPATGVRGAEIELRQRQHDPYGWPRPGAGQEHVPLRTSFYFELGLSDDARLDLVLPNSVTVQLEPEGGEAFDVLRESRTFPDGYRGKLFPGKPSAKGQSLAVYIDGDRPLRPATQYTVRVSARSRDGAELGAQAGTWQFTTETEAATHELSFDLSQEAPAVRWQGGFFTGFCSPSFCTSRMYRISTYELMEQVREAAPRAWSLNRDFWMTGMEHQPRLLSGNLPNLVRERETRRITAIEQHPEGFLLRLEDFFGHEQYGIETGRPLSGDYHARDEVLIADGVHDARARVIAVNDQDATVVVTSFETPSGGWKLAYSAALPAAEDPLAPGLFPPGGCYLRKFAPAGTPVYYWKRLDTEWDLAVRRFERRVIPNFADAPGDLAVDGRNWTTAKDYAQLHDVVRAITGHIIERYGESVIDFPWSVFNEPDLGSLFWRSDWMELQKFYDYTVDGILRAFEDHGYDSNRVFVGGLELGGIFGTNLRLREFLAHCSPRAEAKGALVKNAAFEDPRLDGKRSKRVERLCRDHEGRGSPCDFVSIHAYNRSRLMADKLSRAKEMALEIDAEYYDRLWVNSHESCPGWDLPADPAYADSYLGNGYFPTWCADVARRQLQRGTVDARFTFGESILTFWPWPNPNFGGGNDCVRLLHVDDDGDGNEDRTVTVPMPILHFLGLLATMGDRYMVFPERLVGGHVVSGFASPAEDALRILLYSHHELDTQSRSEAGYQVTLNLADLKGQSVRVEQYRFDKDHNSYFRLAHALRERMEEKLQPEDAVRGKATAALQRITAPISYPAAAVRQVQELSALRRTGSGTYRVDAGRLQITVGLAGNGANFLVVRPE